MKLIYLIIVLVFASCSGDQNAERKEKAPINKHADPLLEKYSGGYYIEVAGSNSNDVMESYVLSKDGSAKWIYILNDGKNGALVDTKKYGTWTATENAITINIEGNTGLITEKYFLNNGVFRDNITGDRRLKRVP